MGRCGRFRVVLTSANRRRRRYRPIRRGHPEADDDLFDDDDELEIVSCVCGEKQ